MNITIFEIDDWERDAFKPFEDEHQVSYLEKPLTTANADDQKDAEIISTFVYSRLDGGILKKLPHLKLITTRSTGFDHIDMDYCKKNGITVCNVPGYGENTVAEHVFALLLAISHRLIDAVYRTRKGDFTSKGLRGFDLRGKTLGVIGTGNIGRNVINIARGFSMKVIASDLNPDMDFAAKARFDYVSMQELLALSDIITLHVPGGKATQNLVSSNEFGTMKKGVVIINTSRGTVIDIHALLHALIEGKVSAAGLDVLPEEPVIREEAELLHAIFTREHDESKLLANHILLHMDNVIITPHNAFNTSEAIQRILKSTHDNINAYLTGNARNTVSDRVGK